MRSWRSNGMPAVPCFRLTGTSTSTVANSPNLICVAGVPVRFDLKKPEKLPSVFTRLSATSLPPVVDAHDVPDVTRYSANFVETVGLVRTHQMIFVLPETWPQAVVGAEPAGIERISSLF